jgi:ssDNA-binding Zn-finger/Zn-ribbon topoisomerase 1
MPAQPISRSPGFLSRLTDLLWGLACPKCSTPMVLRQITPDKPGFDSRIFGCPRCGQQKTKVFKIR